MEPKDVPYLKRGNPLVVLDLDGGCKLHVPTSSPEAAPAELETVVKSVEEGTFQQGA